MTFKTACAPARGIFSVARERNRGKEGHKEAEGEGEGENLSRCWCHGTTE